MEQLSLRNAPGDRPEHDGVSSASSGDETLRTPLHEIRTVRDCVASTLRRLLEMRVSGDTRDRFVSEFAAIDAALVRLYRQERFGESKAYYDDVVSEETNASGPFDPDLASGREYANGRRH